MRTNRQSWDEYFIEVAQMVSKRSSCLSRNVGAIIVKDKNILSAGYNGPATGVEHCSVCQRRQSPDYKSGMDYESCPAVHAEINAIVQAAKHGIAINEATMYCTFLPCSYCMKAILNAGISRIVALEGVRDNRDFVATWQRRGLRIGKPKGNIL